MYDSVTVALNGTEGAERALPVGVAVADRLGVPLALRTVVSPGSGGPERYEAYLDDAATRCGRTASTTVHVGDNASDDLVRAVADGTLLCLTTKALTAVGEFLLGSVAEEVVRLAPRPVLLVGPHAGVPDPAGDTVVSLDGSELSERALAVARDWCAATGSHPWVIQVLDQGTGPASEDVGESSYVARMAGTLGTPADWEVLHDRDAAEAIVSFARSREAATLVLTTHGRGGVSRFVAGSVATDVVREAPCPVLVLRPRDE